MGESFFVSLTTHQGLNSRIVMTRMKEGSPSTTLTVRRERERERERERTRKRRRKGGRYIDIPLCIIETQGKLTIVYAIVKRGVRGEESEMGAF